MVSPFLPKDFPDAEIVLGLILWLARGLSSSGGLGALQPHARSWEFRELLPL